MMKYFILSASLFAFACGGEYDAYEGELETVNGDELVASEATGLSPKTVYCGPDTRFGWVCPMGYECTDYAHDACDGSVDTSCTFICVRSR